MSYLQMAYLQINLYKDEVVPLANKPAISFNKTG